MDDSEAADWGSMGLSDDDSDNAAWPGPMPDAAWYTAWPHAVCLEVQFDGCIVGTSPGGRLVYSTDAMERVLVRRGLSAEEAAAHISPMLGCLLAGYPDFVD